VRKINKLFEMSSDINKLKVAFFLERIFVLLKHGICHTVTICLKLIMYKKYLLFDSNSWVRILAYFTLLLEDA
jgi:hypothetical protein